MKISDIITEDIDQKEADEVLRSLVASGDPAAKYFQQTRYNSVHTTIDSAQRAAERLSRAEQERKNSKQHSDVANKPQASTVRQKPEQPIAQQDRSSTNRGDRFYGNQYTGSLGRGARLGDVDLGIDFDQQGLKTIGKTIGAVKSATTPFSNLATAFRAGINKAPSKR